MENKKYMSIIGKRGHFIKMTNNENLARKLERK